MRNNKIGNKKQNKEVLSIDSATKKKHEEENYFSQEEKIRTFSCNCYSKKNNKQSQFRKGEQQQKIN